MKVKETLTIKFSAKEKIMLKALTGSITSNMMGQIVETSELPYSKDDFAQFIDEIYKASDSNWDPERHE